MCVYFQGLLESVEQEMRTVFTESLFSVYEPVMETSFGRMLVHAVTQYLGLESISKQYLFNIDSVCSKLPCEMKHYIRVVLPLIKVRQPVL